MKKEMLINVLQSEECRIAIVENGVLEELYVERASQESYVGNIYKGRIVNIEPSIQAAFVDFGIGRNGFLHVSDVDPAYYKHLEQRGGGDRGGDRGERRDDRGGRGRDDRPPRNDRAPRNNDRNDRGRGPRNDRNDRGRGRFDREPDRTPASIGRISGPIPDVEDLSDNPPIPVIPVIPPQPRELTAWLPQSTDDQGFGAGIDIDASPEPSTFGAGVIDEMPPPLPKTRDEVVHQPAPEPQPEPVAEADPVVETPIEEPVAEVKPTRKPRKKAKEPEPEPTPEPEAEEKPRRRKKKTAEPEEPVVEAPPVEEAEEESKTKKKRTRTGGTRRRRKPDGEASEGGDEEAPRPMDSAERRTTGNEPEIDPPFGAGIDLDEPAPKPREPELRRDPQRDSQRSKPIPKHLADTFDDTPLPGGDDDEYVPPPPKFTPPARNEAPPVVREERVEVEEEEFEETEDETDEEDEEDEEDDEEDEEDDGELIEVDEEIGGGRPQGDGGRDRGRDNRGRDNRGGPRSGGSSGGRGFSGGRNAGRPKPLIQDIFKRGQEVIIQVIKEPLGTKGPTLSTYISIPGRYLVLMPSLNRIGVSRKIQDDEARDRLKEILGQLRPPKGLGFIIRTAGLDRNKAELQNDLTYLLRLWQVVVRRLKKMPAPVEVYRESDMITRTIRDIVTSDIDTIWIDEPNAYTRALEFLNAVMPKSADRLKFYDGTEPLFHKYRLEEEIAKIHERKVPLPNGGSIVIEQTEALVAIDVNSGSFRSADQNAEETAYQMNLHAAREIARQLRLRDLGGVIVNDFIDMRDEKHRRNVEKAMRDAVHRDRARTKILRISQFGIIEMTRQRIRPALKTSFYMPCPHCKATGSVKTAESVSIEVMRMLQLAAHRAGISSIHVSVNQEVAIYLLNRKRQEILDLEKVGTMQVQVLGQPHSPPEMMEFVCYDNNGNEVRFVPIEAPKLPPRFERDRGRGGDRDRGRGGDRGDRGPRDRDRGEPRHRSQDTLD